MARNTLAAMSSWVSSMSTRGTCVASCFPRTCGVSPTQAVIDHNLYGTTKVNGKCTGGHSYRQAERENEARTNRLPKNLEQHLHYQGRVSNNFQSDVS